MPKIPPPQLARELASGVPPLIVIAGPEEFLRREALDQVRAALGGPEVELDRRSARTPTPDDLVQLIDDLRTPGLFGGTRTIVVEPAEKWITADPDLWGTVLADPWEEGHCVLIAESIDGRTKAARALQKSALWVQVEKLHHRPPPWRPNSPPWDHDLNRWIVQRARSLGLRIDPPTAHLLQSRTGTRLGDLASIIERLLTLLTARGATEVTAELVEEHTPDGEESTLFDVVDTLFQGDRSAALQQVGELLRRGSVDGKGVRTTDGTTLLLQFVGVALSRARQLRLWHLGKARGVGEEELARGIGSSKGFIPRFRQQAAATPPTALEETIDRLVRADCDLKAGAGPTAEELFERIAAGVRPAPRARSGERRRAPIRG